ncbi:MAG: glutathione S-transferase [Gaiellales bacterium]|nr:glutathione S-transferase [Gaiellales bacterium]
MIELYWKPESVADVVAMALRLIGVEHRIVTVGEDVTKDEYLRINPAGTVPAMVDGDLVLFESVAILMYLADQHPDAGLAPAPGTPEHALYDRWLAFILANLMGAYYRWYHGDEMIDGAQHLEALKDGARQNVNAICRRIESELGDRDWLLADGPTMPDLLLGNVAAWGDDIEGIEPLGPRLSGLMARVAAL